MRVEVSVECLRVCSLQSSDLVARVYLGSTHPSTRGYGVTESLLTGYTQGKI